MPDPTFPQEIPWKIFATSKDMMDFDMDDRKFPLKWKSSMSLFYHKPEFDPEILGGRTIVYIKAVCSITGYQVDDKELGMNLNQILNWDTMVYQNFHQLIRDYYPCYGALFQMAVFPYGGKGVNNYYPIIIDFEPKKRELFEVGTETGEVMSRSLHSLKVNTGATCTTSMETIDVDKGWSLGAEVSVGKIGGKFNLGSTYEAGYKASAQGQNVNLRQIDASKEDSEKTSHTTQLQQMYQLLDSYHLGTNRALFVIMPRPHIVNQELSVTNGLRNLEGIQEFFFIVALPKDSKGFCVVGQLETSHLHKEEKTIVIGTTVYDEGQINQKVRDTAKCGTFDWFQQIKRQYPIYVPAGCNVDRTKGNGGYTETKISEDDIDNHVVYVYDDRIVVEITLAPDNPGDGATFDYDYTVYYKSIDPIEEPITNKVTEVDLFMTGRLLKGCVNFDSKFQPLFEDIFSIHDFVSFEERIPVYFNEIYAEILKLNDHPELANPTRQKVNAFQNHIKNRIIASINNPNRYPYGQHTILDTDFVLRKIRHIPGNRRFRNTDYNSLIKVSESISKKVTNKDALRKLKQLTIAKIAESDAHIISNWSGLSVKDVIDLKKSNLTVSRRVINKKTTD